MEDSEDNAFNKYIEVDPDNDSVDVGNDESEKENRNNNVLVRAKKAQFDMIDAFIKGKNKHFFLRADVFHN